MLVAFGVIGLQVGVWHSFGNIDLGYGVWHILPTS